MSRTRKGTPPHSTSASLRRFWQRHVNQWQQCSLSKVGYCKEHELTYHQFIYWHKRLTATPAGELVPVLAPAEGFVQLAVSAPDSAATLQLSLPNGLRIEGIDARSVSLVGSLIAQL